MCREYRIQGAPWNQANHGRMRFDRQLPHACSKASGSWRTDALILPDTVAHIGLMCAVTERAGK